MAGGVEETPGRVDVETARHCLGGCDPDSFERTCFWISTKPGQTVVPAIGHVEEPAVRSDLDSRIGVFSEIRFWKRAEPLAKREPSTFAVDIERRDRAALFVVEVRDVQFGVKRELARPGVLAGVHHRRFQRGEPAAFFIETKLKNGVRSGVWYVGEPVVSVGHDRVRFVRGGQFLRRLRADAPIFVDRV